MFVFTYRFSKHIKIIAAALAVLIIVSAIALLSGVDRVNEDDISWIDFGLSEKMMSDAIEYDIKSYEAVNSSDEGAVRINWIELLACLSAKYWGNTEQYKKSDMQAVAEQLNNGQTMEEICKDLKLYSYYLSAYNAVLGGMVGEYCRGTINDDGTTDWELHYGIKAYSPVAEGYYYEEYDDFGASRSYGYKRSHLGHDMLGSLGTPIIAIESGIVEEMGWNRYGGWRIGIRSLDTNRYYYYAHLRKGHPYAQGLKKGDVVLSGDVIGYMGRTGYSTTEDVNGMTQTHLHWGMQIIFDESKKDSPNQLWIDVYEITKLLSKHRSTVVSAGKDGEFKRKFAFCDPVAERFLTSSSGTQSKAIPIIMYHSILKSSNGRNKYIIKPSQLEEDLKYIRENGYQTVTVSDLYNFVYNGTPLPKKPVMLTFDDGCYNNYYYAYPLLKNYNLKAVFSIVGSYTDNATKLNEDNPNYSYMTWEQVKQAQNSGIIEIQNHSYNLHSLNNSDSIKKQRGESEKSYKSRLTADLEKMKSSIKENTDISLMAFTYPYGILSELSEEVVKQFGFKASLSCREGISTVAYDQPNSLYQLKRNIRTPSISVKKILERYQ